MKLCTDDIVKDLMRWEKVYLRFIKGQRYSENTVKIYTYAISLFIEYAREELEEINIDEINELYISGFFVYLEELSEKRGYKKNIEGNFLMDSTKGAYFKGIASFFKFIGKNNNEKHSFLQDYEDIKITNKQSKPHEYLNADEIKRLVHYLEKKISLKPNFLNYRNALLIKLMLFSGLRISEALGVKMNDFTLLEEKGLYKIRIYGKGGYQQDAYIALDKILNEINYFKENLSVGSFIMVTNKGTKLNRSNTYTMINLIYKKAHIFKTGQHILRHSLAMMLIKRKVPITTIQKTLRHTSITSTTIYARAGIDEVAEALTQN